MIIAALTFFLLAPSPAELDCSKTCDNVEISATQFVSWDINRRIWTSGQTCSNGYPYCWTNTFSSRDIITWKSDSRYNPVNDGEYRIEGVAFNPFIRRFYIIANPKVPQSWGICCGMLGSLTIKKPEMIFKDGFESGTTSKWRVK